MFKRARALRRQALLDEQYRWSNRIHPWWGWGWGSRGYKSDRPDRYSDGSDKCSRNKKDGSKKEDWWEKERARFQQEMERVKKEVEEDPFTALFGKRPRPIRRDDGYQSPWSTFCRNFFGHETQKPTQTTQTNANKTSNAANSESPLRENPVTKDETRLNTSAHEGNPAKQPEKQKAEAQDASPAQPAFRFDPISGRMVPIKLNNPDPSPQSPKDDNGADIPVTTFKSYRAQFGYKPPEDSSNIPGDTATATTSESNKTPETNRGSIEAAVGRDSGKNVLYMAPPNREQRVPSSSPSSGKNNSVSQAADDEPFSGTIKDPRVAALSEQVAPQTDPVLHMASPGVGEAASTSSSNSNGGKSAVPNKPQHKDYSAEEVKTDDVDLLRASDIRAPLYSKKTKYEIDVEKQRNRKELEQEYESFQDPGSDIDAQELRSRVQSYETSSQVSQNAATEQTTPPAKDSIPEQKDIPKSAVRDIPVLSKEIDNEEQVVQEIKHAYEDSYGKITPEHRQPTPRSNQIHQTVAPSSITKDLSRRSPKHPDMKIVTIGSAQGEHSEKDAHRKSQLDDLLKDAKRFNESRDSLMKQIAQTLGRIEPKQSPTPSTTAKPSSSGSTSTSPAFYRVLAYDPATLTVTSAETTSSFYSPDETLHPAEVLPRLNSPAKFLPHFASMQADGYEIVSGGGDILVFKKVREAGKPLNVSDNSFAFTNSIKNETGPENTTVKSQQETVSQTEQKGQASESDTNSTSSSPTMIHRQETVFTGGPPNWSPYPPPGPVEPTPEEKQKAKEEPFLHKASRRILLTGTATAAVCYAIGVVSEYFRTGGSDGRGPEGFTEFEAERRRRE